MFSATMKFTGPVFKAAEKCSKEMHAAVKRAGLIVEREAKATIYAGHASQHLNTGKGALRASIHTTESGLVAKVGTPLIYGRIHEKGGTIRAKNRPYLKFKIGGHWVQVQSVEIKARPYLGPALREKGAEVVATLRGWLGKLVGQ